MQKGERMKISIFLRRRAAKRDYSTTGAVSDLICGVSDSSHRSQRFSPKQLPTRTYRQIDEHQTEGHAIMLK